MAKAPTVNKWQDGIGLFLAVWLYLSPFVLAFVPGALVTGMPAAAWNAWIVSVVIGVFSAAALYRAWPMREDRLTSWGIATWDRGGFGSLV